MWFIFSEFVYLERLFEKLFKNRFMKKILYFKAVFYKKIDQAIVLVTIYIDAIVERVNPLPKKHCQFSSEISKLR